MTPIDLCFALNGPHLETMLPIVMSTMMAHNDMEGVTLHLVDKGCSRNLSAWLHCRSFARIYNAPPAPAGTDGDDTIKDVYETMQWMVENCGENEWVFISHFDLEYTGPLLDYYRSLIAPGVAQIGAHATGLVGYSRKALSECDVSFAHLDDLYIIKETDTGFPLWKIRQKNDPRCTNHDMPVSGWDVGELAELRLSCNKKLVLSETETALQHFRIHNGSGCGRCANANAEIHAKSVATLKRLGLEAIA